MILCYIIMGWGWLHWASGQTLDSPRQVLLSVSMTESALHLKRVRHSMD